MRAPAIDAVDSHPWQVLPVGTRYPPDTVLPYHRRRRAQLLHGSTGLMLVETQESSWTVPTHQAVLIPAESMSSHQHHVFALTLFELQRASTVPLEVPLPHDPALRRACTDYLEHPSLRLSNRDWAQELQMSERSLDCAFRTQIGMSPGAWRTRARMLVGLQLLRSQTITQVSESLGYSLPAAFSREIGRAPSSYL